MLSRIRKAREDEGFTLIELLVVIMIIGILSAIAVPTFLGQRTKGYEKAAMSELASMAIAQESIRTEYGTYINNDSTAHAASGLTNAVLLSQNGYAHTPEVTIEGGMTNSGAGYLICARHNSGGLKFRITHANATPTAIANSTAATACA